MVWAKRNKIRKCGKSAHNLHGKSKIEGQRRYEQPKSSIGIERLLNEKTANFQAKKGIRRAKYVSKVINKNVSTKIKESWLLIPTGTLKEIINACQCIKDPKKKKGRKEQF
jgi:hypothetical protein